MGVVGTIKIAIKNFYRLPKTIWFNFRVFPFHTALHLPVLVGNTVKIKNISRGSIEVNSDVPSFGIFLGTDSVGGITSRAAGFLDIRNGSVLKLSGRATFRRGFVIRMDSNSMVEIGDRFFANDNFEIYSSSHISIGNDVLISWNTCIRDTDGHTIQFSDGIINSPKEIIISDRVWIGSNASVLKGAYIGPDSVVAQGSIVTRKFTSSNVIIGGNPSIIIKEGIKWEK